MAVGFPVKANYVTGEVLTAANMNDLSGSVNLLESAQYAAGKNPVLNSAFQIWQRGTTSASITTAATYTADRWALVSGASTAMVVSRQATGDTTNLPFIQYCSRVQRTAGQTGVSAVYFAQSIESINSIPFANKTVTLSFYARKGANYSSATSVVNAVLQTGTGTDQSILSGGLTGAVNAISQNATLTTTWQRFSYTGTIGATATQLAMFFSYTPVGTAGAADYFELTGVQIEINSVASSYQSNSSTIQGELAACQRYYFRATPGSFSTFGSGVNSSTTASNIVIPFPVTMRTAPTAIEQTGTASDYRMSHTTATTCSAVPVFSSASINQSQISFTVASGLTSGGAALAQSNAAGAYLGWSAEL
jgi:hypothetical protein